MKLYLRNEYPFPFVPPDDPDDDPCLRIQGPIIEGVTNFEWVHTLTIEFKDRKAFDKAREAFGWTRWSGLVLEADLSSGDGYDHPAIVSTKYGRAWCGFMILDDNYYEGEH